VPAAPAACGAGRVEFVERLVDAKRYADHNAYPVNELRNLAIARVRTSHFLLCDVDLWPDEQLYDRLHALGASVAHNATFADPKVAIVVPAFSREVKTDCASSTGKEDHADASRMASCHREADAMPATFEDLKRCIVAKECHIFDRFNHDGHGTTDYKSWLNTKSKALRPVDCFLSNRYEPYVVLRKSPLLPPYEERFVGYGKNKIQNIVHMRYAGFSFAARARAGREIFHTTSICMYSHGFDIRS
jgi:hypothetical protein